MLIEAGCLNELTTSGLDMNGELAADVDNLLIISGADMRNAPDHDLFISPTMLDFGIVELGDCIPVTVIVESPDHPISIITFLLDLSITGPEAGDFFSTSLPPIERRLFGSIKFTPTTTGDTRHGPNRQARLGHGSCKVGLPSHRGECCCQFGSRFGNIRR